MNNTIYEKRMKKLINRIDLRIIKNEKGLLKNELQNQATCHKKYSKKFSRNM